jgi:hypothetical protein
VTGHPTRYWLERFAQAIENAVDAPGESSRRAYMDLADHYWSMHVLIHGQPRAEKNKVAAIAAGAGLGDRAHQLRWAA